ncbi:YaiO family outer membrane beta-barrel protein [Flavobacterium sp. MC2016-06]|jgi:YaiO family outer membrane protein|uniref:YaiO family outer membrane beta-barrel protein n=1 Tax=Flavobacterium sp. MC2016-06 TaxID=2676308 RepID=UPI0012BAE735|nr:YaiO family outer membrane beta-barrel protein [Flavobacterium sp. MC2016-06]MBU3857552.1 YaiO family outer membrane beta-barrel protein [Flavobacterium sp. MC2016-06]
MKFLKNLFFLFFITFTAAGQEINVDAVMSDIKREVENGNYDKALSLIEPLHKKFPQDEDIIIYTGRIYSWKKDYTTAIQILTPIADRTNPNTDALLAIINTYFWSEQFDTTILYCDKYLAVDPNSIDVKIIKAKSLERLNRDKEASAILETIAVTENSTLAITGLRTLIGRKAKNAIAVSYLNISTSSPGQAPLHYGYVEYSHKFSTSALVGRANIGHVNDDTQMLFEADYYKTFSKKNYLYVNAGVSTGQTIFPIARGGIEYYFIPHKKFDYALGLRFMHFENDNVTLLTGQFAYHIGTYTLAYRPFYDTSNALFSHVLSIQTTNEEKESLLRFELQYGSVPYLYLYNASIKPLNAYRVGLQYQQRLGNSFFVRPVLLYEYEEYLPNQYRNKFNVQVIVTKRF